MSYQTLPPVLQSCQGGGRGEGVAQRSREHNRLGNLNVAGQIYIFCSPFFITRGKMVTSRVWREQHKRIADGAGMLFGWNEGRAPMQKE